VTIVWPGLHLHLVDPATGCTAACSDADITYHNELLITTNVRFTTNVQSDVSSCLKSLPPLIDGLINDARSLTILQPDAVSTYQCQVCSSDVSKVFPYPITSAEHGADPSVLAVNPQVTFSHKHSGRLPLPSTRPMVTFSPKRSACSHKAGSRLP